MPTVGSACRLVCAAVFFLATASLAQHGGPGGGGGAPGGGPPGMGPRGSSFGSIPPEGMPPGRGHFPPESHNSEVASLHGPMQLGPPGRWWRDEHFAQDLGLSSKQQKRMDAIFSGNRATLIANLHTLHDEEGKMQTLSHSAAPDEATVFAEIDRIAQAHAALEKTNAHMLLSIRHEMSADQISRLETYRPKDEGP